MTVFTGMAADGRTITYKDKKRHLWSLGYIGPLVSLSSIWLYFALDKQPLACLIPALYMYAITPIIDMILGVDNHNPPEEVMDDMAKDRFYKFQVISRIPISFIIFFAYVWFVGTQDLPWWAILALVIGVGGGSGTVLVLTHELGHKPGKWNKFWSKLGNTLLGYGHFNIEHNRGHHVWVSTPEDPASSRMGESIYRFQFRELPGTIKRGLDHERRRLQAQGRGFWSVHNDVLQVYVATTLIIIACAVYFGPHVLWFIIPHHFIGWYALTQANYIEHYGLLREKRANGKYEPCQPRHSWNTNHLWSNMALFHLQRHSDHHAYPQRPYQVLRDFPDLPTLPNGYGGCFVLAAIPPLWYKVMDKKVMAWADGDITKVNIDPKRKDRLYAKWGVPDTVPAE